MAEMETQPEPTRKGRRLARGFAPAVPAAVGASALTLLFAAAMPMAWVSGLAWNLYLDRLSGWFEPPVGDAGRLALAAGLAPMAGLLAALAALAMIRPAVQGNRAMNRRVAARAKRQDDAEPSRRRRADMHPDAPPRPPIRAASDLPAGGLGPVPLVTNDLPLERADVEDDMLELSLTDLAPENDELLLGEEAAAEIAPLAPAADIAPPSDGSLGAMVARLEAGLDRRRQLRAAGPGTPISQAANEDGEPIVDFALEAALSTLQRMTRRSV